MSLAFHGTTARLGDGETRGVNRLASAVIFDMDGLLFDSEALYRDAIITAAGELGHPFTVADFLKLVGRPWTINRATLQQHIGPTHNPDTFRAAWMRKFEDMRASLALKAGVVAMLDWLDERGVARAICTSSTHADVQHKLGLHALTGRFDAVIASGDYVEGKPSPDPYLRAAEMLCLDPADCIALEESHNGVRAASAAGMQTVMVPDLLPATDEIRALCKLVAIDLHEVRAYLSSLYPPP
jgi:HAD superfamily hydrolase (TIGR01509 family)